MKKIKCIFIAYLQNYDGLFCYYRNLIFLQHKKVWKFIDVIVLGNILNPIFQIQLKFARLKFYQRCIQKNNISNSLLVFSKKIYYLIIGLIFKS